MFGRPSAADVVNLLFLDPASAAAPTVQAVRRHTRPPHSAGVSLRDPSRVPRARVPDQLLLNLDLLRLRLGNFRETQRQHPIFQLRLRLPFRHRRRQRRLPRQ